MSMSLCISTPLYSHIIRHQHHKSPPQPSPPSISHLFSNNKTQRQRQHHRQSSSSSSSSSFSLSSSDARLNFLAFTLIIDDLVFWDGTTMMSQLGGGGSQTLFGYIAYSYASLFTDETNATYRNDIELIQSLKKQGVLPRVGLAAGIGNDLPLSCRDWLLDNDIDISGLLQYDNAPTPRAWQILEEDGRRHEIWRTDQSPIQSSMLLPSFDSLPLSHQSSQSFHLGVNPEDPPISLLHSLYTSSNKKNYILSDSDDISVSIETFKPSSRPLDTDEINSLVKYCDIFSPNEEEAASILGIDVTELLSKNLSEGYNDDYVVRLTTPFIDAGAPFVALRRGARGAVIHERKRDKIWHVPAYRDTIVVDTTGCGNAFCGAFLAALRNGEHPIVAGAYGCAAGSIMAEYRGVPGDVSSFGGVLYERMKKILSYCS